MNRFLLLVTIAACTRAEPPPAAPPAKPAPAVRFAKPPIIAPAPSPATAKVTVGLTAVTLADDCGTPAAGAATKGAAKRQDSSEPYTPSRNRGVTAPQRRCEQTSMQLSVIADATSAPTEITIKKVELFDDNGKSIGELTPRQPTRWSANGVYEAWDQKVAAGAQLSVSYLLSQPQWNHVASRWNRTFTLKVTVTIGGADQSVSKDVHLKSPPTSLPPNVRT